MSALPPKADMCGSRAYVCFGPKADVRSYRSALPRVEFPDTATNGLVEAVRDGNAVVAFKNFNDALDLTFRAVVTLLAPHIRDCLVKMFDHNFSVCFPFLHAVSLRSLSGLHTPEIKRL